MGRGPRLTAQLRQVKNGDIPLFLTVGVCCAPERSVKKGECPHFRCGYPLPFSGLILRAIRNMRGKSLEKDSLGRAPEANAAVYFAGHLLAAQNLFA